MSGYQPAFLNLQRTANATCDHPPCTPWTLTTASTKCTTSWSHAMLPKNPTKKWLNQGPVNLQERHVPSHCVLSRESARQVVHPAVDTTPLSKTTYTNALDNPVRRQVTRFVPYASPGRSSRSWNYHGDIEMSEFSTWVSSLSKYSYGNVCLRCTTARN